MNKPCLLRSIWLLAMFCMFSAVPLVNVGHGSGPKHNCCPDCGRSVCRLVREPVADEKYCYQVECKQLCIPKIRWPWQSCCDAPQCGRVKTVKVLKRVEYECEACGYRWELQPAPCGGN